MNPREIVQQLRALGFTDTNYALTNAVVTAMDGGVPGASIIAAAVGAGKQTSRLVNAIQALRANVPADAPRVTLGTPENAVGLPAGAYSGTSGPLTAPQPGGGTPLSEEGDPRELFKQAVILEGGLPQDMADGRILVSFDQGDYIYEFVPGTGWALSSNQRIEPASSGGGGGGGGGGFVNTVSIITSPTGKAYRVDQFGNVLGEVAELSGLPPGYTNIDVDKNGNLVGIDNAGNYKVIQENFDFQALDPALTTVKNNRTGETMLVNQRTGESSSLGQFDWATIDPERTFQEGIRQYDTTEGRLREEMERTRGLAETDFISEILRNPSDYITSAFLRRGVESGLTPLTQAGIISGLREAITGGPRGNAPAAQPRIPAPKPQAQPQLDPNTYSSPGVVSTVYGQPVTQTTQPGRGSQPIGTSSVLLNDGTNFTVDQNRIDTDPGYLSLIEQSVTQGRALPGLIKAEQGGILTGPYISGDSPDGLENEEINIPLPSGETVVISSRTMEPEAFEQLKMQFGGEQEMPKMATGGLVPGQPLAGTGGGYVAADGSTPVIKDAAGKDWVMVNGQFVPYTPPPPAPVLPVMPKPVAKPVVAPVATQYSSATNPLLNITDQQIMDTAKQYAPPGVSALLAGTTEQLSPLQFPEGVGVATPRQMARLTDTERDALSTRLAADNVYMSDYNNATQQLFGNQRSQRRGRLII